MLDFRVIVISFVCLRVNIVETDSRQMSLHLITINKKGEINIYTFKYSAAISNFSSFNTCFVIYFP